MKPSRIVTTLLLAFAWAFAAQAGDTLISGSIRVGAYDVEVQNASQTNWVNGDLVITYLNTNATVTKSFTLPKATTGRLLAVGGGGAGGQDRMKLRNTTRATVCPAAVARAVSSSMMRRSLGPRHTR